MDPSELPELTESSNNGDFRPQILMNGHEIEELTEKDIPPLQPEYIHFSLREKPIWINYIITEKDNIKKIQPVAPYNGTDKPINPLDKKYKTTYETAVEHAGYGVLPNREQPVGVAAIYEDTWILPLYEPIIEEIKDIHNRVENIEQYNIQLQHLMANGATILKHHSWDTFASEDWSNIRAKFDNEDIHDKKARYLAAEKLSKDIPIRNVVYGEKNTVMHYNKEKGIYEEGEQILNHKITKELQHHATGYTRNEIRKQAISMNITKPEEMEVDPYKLPVKNGVLDLQTLELESYLPQKNITWKLPTEYDPDADCPLFKEFLQQILPTNRPPYWKRDTIQEYMGYILYHWGMPFHKFLMIVGEGSNGKSQIINAIKEVIGEDNTCSKSIYGLSDDDGFGKQRLNENIANFDSDISANKLRHTGIFKKLCGDDQIVADRKNKKEIEFYNTCKMIFSAQQVPETQDMTHAFWRRPILIPFSEQIPDEKKIREIGRKIARKEASGILNWMIEGYQRLLEQGGFSYELDEDDMYDLWHDWGDALDDFCKNYLTVVEEKHEFTPSDNIYQAYREHSKESGQAPLSKNWFVQKMKAKLGVQKQMLSIDGERINHYPVKILKDSDMPKQKRCNQEIQALNGKGKTKREIIELLRDDYGEGYLEKAYRDLKERGVIVDSAPETLDLSGGD